MGNSSVSRRLPVGAEVQQHGGVHFRVWAPKRSRVAVVLLGESGRPQEFALTPEAGGYFAGLVDVAQRGTNYQFRLDGEDRCFPDPASRFQPHGPDGPAQVVDPDAFRWQTSGWKGLELKGQVVYELHVGTFTRAGNWAAAAEQLAALKELGITVVELMPVAEFGGSFGWGYDGVDLFAPTRLYGQPDDMRRFVDRAHYVGLGVILDVVYNHFGPVGNYVSQYSDDYTTDRYENEWGEAINFDGERAAPVREFFIANAGYWIDEYHLDGLRLDATQSIHDQSPRHVLEEIGVRVRQAAQGRSTIIVSENEPQHVRLVKPPAQGGYGLDALWNDDFHHVAMVATTGRNEAYYTDYLGSPQELISTAKWGFLYQGQRYRWQSKARGTPTFGIDAARFVTYVQNHDQVANSATGERLHQLTSPGRYRTITALMLLAPGTPMLFQGQEFASSAPFLFFADHDPELAKLVRQGRAEFLHQFPSIPDFEHRAELAPPDDPSTFERCKLDFAERETHAWAYALHGDLLRLRREDPVFAQQSAERLHGAVLGSQCFVLRYFGNDGDDRLLVVNFGRDLELLSVPEPLLAPSAETAWVVIWASEDPRYGGRGVPPTITDQGWRVPGEAAVVFAPRKEVDARG
jgi:maltooligosyltrehalose trehalohydrolase